MLFRSGRLYVLGAPRKNGKTTVLVNWLSHLAFHEQIPCALFSLEMKATALAEKIIAAEASVDSFRLRMATLDGEEWVRITNAIANRYEAPLYIDDRRAVKADYIAAQARRAVRRYGVRVVAVDYFQLVSRGRAESARIGYVDICHAMQALAGEANVAVVLLSQIGRSAQARPDQRPTTADLMETSALEQDADVVTLLYHRPDGIPSPEGNVLELIVAANRHGPERTAPVYWQPGLQRVRDVTDAEDNASRSEGPRNRSKPFWQKDGGDD